MNILIIGGSRFSGKQLLLKLATQEHKITIINRGIHPINYPSNCTHVAMDRNDELTMRTFLKDKSFDWVFDFIAWRGPETAQIISMLEGKIKKFVHISTVDVYDLARINNYPTLLIFE
ncbi:MAG: NAD-dependent epimerase/dehydratase family protein, partial [Promethearchaeota archaeon]